VDGMNPKGKTLECLQIGDKNRGRLFESVDRF
jgi:hypothetical protein